MDKTPLVTSDQEIEGQVVEALSRAQIPVTAVDWTWVPQFEASQLVVVTPLHDTKGPREAYARILEALSVAGIYQSVPIRELFVVGPEDPLAQELVRQLKFITEGTIRVSKWNGGARAQYSVVFTPYLGTGGAIPSVQLNGVDELRSFLEKRLGILPYVVDQALEQLSQKGSASIFNVQLDLRRAKKLNLAA
jgi:hypothetical protein